MGKNPAQKAKQTKETTGKTTSARADKKAKKPAKKKVVAKADGPKAEAKPTGRCGGKRCTVKACKREYKAKGYCRVHYKKWRHGEYGQARYKSCGDLSCFKPMVANRHGYCEGHYQNYYVKGMEISKTAPEAAKPAADEKAAASA